MNQLTEEQQMQIDEIARRYNVQIRHDDPAFAILALNDLAQRKFIEHVETMLKEIAYQVSELNIEQREEAKTIAEQAIANGSAYIAKTTVAAIEEFHAAVKATMAKELAAIRKAGEEVRKDRQIAWWIALFVTGVVAMLVGAKAASWLRGY